MAAETRQAEILVADIGSTLTKLTALAGVRPGREPAEPVLLGQGLSRTTAAEGDVTLGLDAARADLENRLGIDTARADLMAASSAAGGLRMTVHGLTREMTLRAAREASLGAGAIIALATAGGLQDHDLDEIRRIRPSLILLSGGVDDGEREIILANARALAGAVIPAPVVYAGNQAVRKPVTDIFKAAGQPIFPVENVYPRIDELNIEPVRRVIQDVFARHIVTAPGMEKVREAVVAPVIPTPGAVLRAAELLAGRLGDLLIVDVGGATTDVHSVTSGSPANRRRMIAPEPRSRRTVEGDLGVYVNAGHVIAAAQGALAHIGPVPPLPGSIPARDAVAELTRWAVDLAIWRHAGRMRIAYGASGRSELVDGRDLGAVRTLIGTGGALIRLGMGLRILGDLRRDPLKQKLLPPPDARILIDRDYIMAAAGVLADLYPEAAAALMLRSIGAAPENETRPPCRTDPT